MCKPQPQGHITSFLGFMGQDVYIVTIYILRGPHDDTGPCDANCMLLYFNQKVQFNYIYKVTKLKNHESEIYLMSRSADDGGEHSPGGVVTGEPGLAHSRSIVHNKSGYVFVTHFSLLSLILLPNVLNTVRR